MLSKANTLLPQLRRFLKKHLPAAIPFVASFFLLLLSWFNRQTWILWDIVILGGVVLLPAAFFSYRPHAPFSLSWRSVPLLLIGFGLQVLCQGFPVLYENHWHVPLGLWPQWVIALLLSIAIAYHNHLKKRASDRGGAPIAAYSLPSKNPSWQRLLLMLSHYACGNGNFCLAAVMLLTLRTVLWPQWDYCILQTPLPGYLCCMAAMLGIIFLLNQSLWVSKFLARFSLSYTALQLGCALFCLIGLGQFSFPELLSAKASLLGSWLQTPLATSSSGLSLLLSVPLFGGALLAIVGLKIAKLSWSLRVQQWLIIPELFLWGIAMVCYFSWLPTDMSSLSLGAIKQHIAQMLWQSRYRPMMSQPLGLILLSLPLFSGLIHRLRPLSADYFGLFLGLICPLPHIGGQPTAALILICTLIVGNAFRARHLVYACDAPWEACHRTLIKGQRWFFPITFSCWMICLSTALLPRPVIFLLLENFGLIFLFSLMLIALLEGVIALELFVKSWYSNRHIHPALIPT